MTAPSQSDEPPWWPYVSGVLIGVVGTIGVCSLWLPSDRATTAALLGGVGALLGVFLLENIGEAVAITLVVALMLVVGSGLTSPLPFWLSTIIAPTVVGHCFGRLVCGVWKEFWQHRARAG